MDREIEEYNVWPLEHNNRKYKHIITLKDNMRKKNLFFRYTYMLLQAYSSSLSGITQRISHISLKTVSKIDPLIIFCLMITNPPPPPPKKKRKGRRKEDCLHSSVNIKNSLQVASASELLLSPPRIYSFL